VILSTDTSDPYFFVSWMVFYLQIVEVEMPFDKTKNQRKGFCFITFESEQVVQELLKSPKQSINGKEVILVFVL
jgi:RNA recognition motif-containing protein